MTVGKANSNVSHDCGVAEISLEPGYGELAAEESEDGVGQSKVTFSILEHDGIDLVRHCGGANFTFDGPLFEVVQRAITPDISCKVNQDGVDETELV